MLTIAIRSRHVGSCGGEGVLTIDNCYCKGGISDGELAVREMEVKES